MKYFFPLHINGGNRGCEAIAKGVATIFNEAKENLISFTTDKTLDVRLGVDRYVSMIAKPQRTLWQKASIIVFKLFHRDKYSRVLKEYSIDYDMFIRIMEPSGVMVSTGGDMMCYKDNQVIYTLDKAHELGMKTILCGCSMGEKNLSPLKLEALRKFDLLYVRESLTESFFKSLNLKNIICYPDPAFSLEPEKVLLPNCFTDKKVIGLNISRMVVGKDSLDTPFALELLQLIEQIINNNEYNILLIPHVLWHSQDDRILSKKIKSLYSDCSRIQILNSDQYNYCQIRYIISKCKLFLGGRTHSVISAYSTCIPSIALGYSIKALGIAKDLGLDERLVVDCVNYRKGELLSSFAYLQDNKDTIKSHLESTMPTYKNRLSRIKEEINKYIS